MTNLMNREPDGRQRAEPKDKERREVGSRRSRVLREIAGAYRVAILSVTYQPVSRPRPHK